MVLHQVLFLYSSTYKSLITYLVCIKEIANIFIFAVLMKSTVTHRYTAFEALGPPPIVVQSVTPR